MCGILILLLHVHYSRANNKNNRQINFIQYQHSSKGRLQSSYAKFATNYTIPILPCKPACSMYVYHTVPWVSDNWNVMKVSTVFTSFAFRLNIWGQLAKRQGLFHTFSTVDLWTFHCLSTSHLQEIYFQHKLLILLIQVHWCSNRTLVISRVAHLRQAHLCHLHPEYTACNVC